MIRKTLLKFSPYLMTGACALPLIASAAVPGANINNWLLLTLLPTMQTVIRVLFVLATVVFLWGVVMFIIKAGNETERNKAKGIMLWGIIGLAVMAAAWGITTILIDYFDIGRSPDIVPIPIP